MSFSVQEFFRLGMDRRIPDLLQSDGFLSIDLGASGEKKTCDVALGAPQWEFPRDPIPACDNSVNKFHAFHFLEHLSGEEAIALLREMERCLEPGGIANITVPYYSSSMQAQDLTHKSVWNEGTLPTLFDNPYYDPAGKWKLRIHTQFIMGIVERNLALFIQLQKEY